MFAALLGQLYFGCIIRRENLYVSYAQFYFHKLLSLNIFLKGSTLSLLANWVNIWGHLNILHQKAVVIQLFFQRPIA